MTARHLLIFATICLTACLQPTDTTTGSISLSGRWQYSAQQSGAGGTTLSGTMTIEPRASSGFQGSVDAVATSQETGESRNVAGTVSGTAPTADAIDFDVYLEQLPRRHVGQLVGDKLSGTWIRLSADGTTASGTFTARRLSP
jgi:hypothetical protein